jgi:hypothetical protein
MKADGGSGAASVKNDPERYSAEFQSLNKYEKKIALKL